MDHKQGWLLMALALPMLAACTSLLSCPVTVDVYCASAAVPECAQLDYETALWQWNQDAAASPASSSKSFGCDQTDDYDVLSVEDTTQRAKTTRYFARSTGQLVAILRDLGEGKGRSCVAGPPLFAAQSSGETGGRCGYGIPPDGAVGD